MTPNKNIEEQVRLTLEAHANKYKYDFNASLIDEVVSLLNQQRQEIIEVVEGMKKDSKLAEKLKYPEDVYYHILEELNK